MRWLLLIVSCWLAALARADIVVGFGANKPPYVFEQGRAGLEYDIVMASFAAVGVSAQPYFAPQGRLHALLGNRLIDVITTTSEQSGIEAYYSDVYIVYQNYAITLSDRHLDIHTIDDLSRYSVTAFQRASTNLGPQFRAAVAKSPQYTEQAKQVTRDILLFAGRVDVAVADRRIFDYFRQEIGSLVDIRQAVTYHAIFPPTPYRAAFRDEALRDSFNRGLATIRRNGSYDEIQRRYAGY